MSEHMDPEQVRNLINNCFNHLVPIIERYEGMVDKFIGDEIMALFGAPIAHEDDPLRAVQTAWEMMHGLKGFNKHQQTNLNIHIGINTGLVVAGGIGAEGHQEYSVLGDAVNLAARLEEISQPGEILVGTNTYHQAKHAFAFEKLEPISIQGKTEKVTIYRILNPLKQIKKTPDLTGLVSSLVGRHQELDILQTTTKQLMTTNQTSFIWVSGEAGLGKSRLLAEWGAIIVEPLHWLTIQCISYGQQLPYHLITNFIHQLVDIPPATDDEKAYTLLKQFVAQTLPDDDNNTSLYLAHLLKLHINDLTDLTIDPQSLQARYFTIIRQILIQLSQQKPTIIIIEDIHWADPASIDLFSDLLPISHTHPILFCIATRPEPDTPGWRLLQTAETTHAEHLYHLTLTALSANESQQLISNLLEIKALPVTLRELILSHAEGNPLFVEEIIRMFIEQNYIYLIDDQWQARADITAITIPDTLQSLLLARIDQLPPQTKHTLRIAAVIGRTFSLKLLEIILKQTWTDISLEQILSYVWELENNDLIKLVQKEPDIRYAFRHALLRDAAYQSLLQTSCQQIHYLVASALEELHADNLSEQATVLAHHFRSAAKNQRASHYFILAGNNAYNQFAHEEAMTHYRTALECQPALEMDISTLKHLYKYLGRSLEHLSQSNTAWEHYQELATIAKQRQNESLYLTALVLQAKLAAVPGPMADQQLGAKLAKEGLQLARQLNNKEEESRLLWILLMLDTFSLSVTAQTIAYGRESLAIARALNLKEQQAFTLHNLSIAYMFINRLERSIPTQLEANKLWEEQNNQAMLADGLSNLCVGYTLLGQFKVAIPQAQKSYDLAKSINHLWGQATSQFMITIAYIERGELTTGLHSLSHAVTQAKEINHLPILASSRSDLALIYGYFSQWDTANQIIEATLTASNHYGALLPWVHSVQALLLMWQEEWTQAESILQPYIQQSAKINSMGIPARITYVHAYLAYKQEDWPTILTITDHLISFYNESNSQLFKAAILTLRGLAFHHLNQPQKCQEALQNALQLAQKQNLKNRLWSIYHALAQTTDAPHEKATYLQKAVDTINAIADQCEQPKHQQGFLNHPDIHPIINL
ncbi:MAG TPA: adenylate/guanylate cyclase domain-containing protein [Anaerolineae bacterium]|nr:adenylate/guanylate cyclase domain-containing protein [Anaerolineae bacterium]